MTPTDNREWLRLTAQRYDSMKRRFGPKYDKRGLCKRPGMALPFSLDEYRKHVLDLFGGNWHSTVKCSYYSYCQSSVNIYSLQLDHKFPPSRGGSLALDNLVPSCPSCNSAKGSMSHAAFLGLIEFCTRIPIPDRVDLMNRLTKSTKFIQGRAHARKFFPKRDSIRLSPIRRLRWR